jgi:HEAT repeat protein
MCRHGVIAVMAGVVLMGYGAAVGVAPDERVEQLAVEIRQRDSLERRERALERVREMLGQDAAAQETAMMALTRTGDIRYDRAGLADAVVPLLQSPAAQVRGAALLALPTVSDDPLHIDAAAALASDPDPQVRAGVMRSIVFLRQATKIETPVHEPALTLLSDADEDVVVGTAQSLWSVPLAPEVEAKVIELSRFGQDQAPSHSSVPYRMMYFVLSTRPRLSEPVAQRLAEIARHPKLDGNWTGRAVWGLARAAEPAAADDVTKALIDELDHSLVHYNRQWAVRGLMSVKTDAATRKLAEVAEQDESEELRQLAARALPR